MDEERGLMGGEEVGMHKREGKAGRLTGSYSLGGIEVRGESIF